MHYYYYYFRRLLGGGTMFVCVSVCLTWWLVVYTTRPPKRVRAPERFRKQVCILRLQRTEILIGWLSGIRSDGLRARVCASRRLVFFLCVVDIINSCFSTRFAPNANCTSNVVVAYEAVCSVSHIIDVCFCRVLCKCKTNRPSSCANAMRIITSS